MRLAMSPIMAAGMAATASASVHDLRITELFAGELPGMEATPDWFELTNMGSNTVGTGGLFYDNGSFDATENSALIDLDINPGESAIFLVGWEDHYTRDAEAIEAFRSAWGSQTDNVGVGVVNGGSGLGGGGDSAVIFSSNLDEMLANIITVATYTVDAQAETFINSDEDPQFNEFSQLGELGAFVSAQNATDDPSSGPMIGSPGVFIPAPASAAILGSAGLAAARRRH